MTQNNIPAGIQDQGEMNEVRMKICPTCEGDADIISECCGASIDSDILICSDCKEHSDIQVCETCNGEGEIEMTPEEIRDEIEEKKEKQLNNEL